MERLRTKELQIIDWFNIQFNGHVQHDLSSWTDLRMLIISFFETCDTIKSQKSKLAYFEEIVAFGPEMLKKCLNTIERPNFPVSKWYKNRTLEWLQLVFEDHLTITTPFKEVSSKDLKDSKFAFKTHDLNGNKVTILEESSDPMGNEDGTTGLITWQGAVCLYNWITVNASWLFNKESKVIVYS